jgi:hypothetical protein
LNKRILGITILGFLFSSVFPSYIQATLLENVPLDSWVYSVVEELYTQGLFPELHKEVKPYTRGEIASLLLQINLKQRDDRLTLTDSQLWLISKLNQEFKYELEELYQGDQTDQNKTNVVKYGTSPVVSSNLAERDSSYGRVQARFDLGIEFNRKMVWYDRVVIDNQAQKERSYQTREWKHHLAGTFDEAYANLNLKYFNLLLGRDHIQWGPGKGDVLLLSGQIPPFDMIKAEAKFGSFKLICFSTVLDQIYIPPVEENSLSGFWAKRYLSGHRLNLKLKSGLETGISEVVLYGGENRNPEAYYLNPLLPYYGDQYNRDVDDNIMWSWDISITWFKNKELYFELLVDDFQYDFKSEPQQTGYQLGLNYAEPFGFKRSYLNMEYTKINNWVYGQNKPWNVYTYDGRGIGSILGPDADRWIFGLTYHWTKDIDFMLIEEYRRRGEGRIETPQPGVVPASPKFPSGVVEYTNLLQLAASYQPNANLKFDLVGEYDRVSNPNNQSGKKEDTMILWTKLSINLWKESKF